MKDILNMPDFNSNLKIEVHPRNTIGALCPNGNIELLKA